MGNRAYYIPGEWDTAMHRFIQRRILHKRRIPAFPEVIQVQTVTGCNADCVFCPNKKVSAGLAHGRMSADLFHRLADEISTWETRRVSLYLMNEPLLDRQLPEKIAFLAERKKPGTLITLNSNGSALDEEMAAD